MKVTNTPIQGVLQLDLTKHLDERGYFARLYCKQELKKLGVEFDLIQVNLSRNTAKHTLRGLHYQERGFEEAKIVRAVRGSAFDVVVDLRTTSPTYKQWYSSILTEEESNALIIPEGCAHGFITLKPNTDIMYQMNRAYIPGHSRGLRYDDPSLMIDWPAEPSVISATDSRLPIL